jgi:hypothetical protein
MQYHIWRTKTCKGDACTPTYPETKISRHINEAYAIIEAWFISSRNIEECQCQFEVRENDF